MRLVLALFLLCGFGLEAQQAIRQNPGFKAVDVPRNDDGSGPLTSLGFTINFFGKRRSDGYVNNNGNITFDSPLSTYTPFGLEGTQREIVAAFFADVDTRDPRSALVTYGPDTVDGRRAFGANYVEVGYYNTRADKLNRFQIVIIERADTGDGNFDLEFNYERIVWETGDASGGVGGFGGVSASVGWSNGTGDPGTSFELAGSLVPGSFLESGRYALTRNRLNSTVTGRFVFRARNGVLRPPLTVSTQCPLPSATAGQRYLAQMTAVGGGPTQRWTIQSDPGANLPPGLTLSADGTLTGVPISPGAHEFTLRVTSSTSDGDESAVKRCSLRTVAPAISVITPCPLPSGTAGQAYRQTLLAGGGRPPYQWDLVEGSPTWPAGLTLDSSGVLAGVPTASGSATVLLRVRSNPLDEAEPVIKVCAVTIARPVQTVVSGCSLPPATMGVPYSRQLTPPDVSGPLSWTALDPLPAGLALDPAGRIDGIPASTGTSSFRVRSRDASGSVAEQRCTLAVTEPQLRATSSCPLPTALIGERYEQRFTAEGGDGAYVWAPLGTLPPGLSLSSSGVLSGFPAGGGNFAFRLLLSDSGGRAATTGCNLTVLRSGFSLTSCPLPDATSGIEYSRRLAAEGGAEPLLFSATGPLPAGLTLSSTGLLSGRTTESGTYSIPIRVTDARGRVIQQPCGLSVQPSPIRISGQCPMPNGTVGAGYATRFTVSGGAPPYRWSVGGSLPTGLTLNPDGTVQGTPLAPGSTQFVLEARDSTDRFAILRCSAEVELPDPPVIRLSALPAEVRAATAGPTVTIELSRPYSLPVEGQVVLDVEADTGAADATVNRADPVLRFANGDRQWSFRIAPGATRASMQITSTGTVASTVTVRVPQTRTGGAPLRINPAPRQFRIPRTAPVLTDACYTTGTGTDSLEIRVDGYSTTRRVDLATLTRAGLEPVRIATGGTSDAYFSSDASVRTGGAFTVTFPASVAAAEWSITLQNAAGVSASRTLRRCQ